MVRRTKDEMLRLDADDEIWDERDIDSPIEIFKLQQWITEVLFPVKSGKEATVYCCQAHPKTGYDLLAIKVYHSRDERNFKNDAIYREGTVIRDKRLARAVKNKSQTGRALEGWLWVEHEFENLTNLFNVGADVPKPHDMTGNGILMEYIGFREKPAPILNNVKLEQPLARILFETVISNIRLFLTQNLIHSDLSSFNILFWNNGIKIIDFPQAVDIRTHPRAYYLLLRDVRNVCRYWERYGIQSNPNEIAKKMWEEFKPTP